MYLSKNIRYLRKKAGYSQEKLADILGYKSFTTIQKWESGVAEPSILILRKMADLFNVDLEAMTEVDMEFPDTDLLSRYPGISREPVIDKELLDLIQSLDEDDVENLKLYIKNVLLLNPKYNKKDSSVS